VVCIAIDFLHTQWYDVIALGDLPENDEEQKNVLPNYQSLMLPLLEFTGKIKITLEL